MQKKSISDISFDLSLINKIAQEYNVNKNDRIKNIYQSTYEPVPLELQEEQKEEFQVQNIIQPLIKQYLSSKVYPDNRDKVKNSNPPNITLELEFVNGYNSLEGCQNLFYVDKDNIVFSSATLGIKMNTKTRKQQFYGIYGEQTSSTSYNNFHRGSICSLDYYNQKKWVVTGSMCLNPEIIVWQPQNLKFISKFQQGKKTKSASIVRFFMHATYIISVERSSKSSQIHIWTIQGEKKTSVKAEGSVYQVATYQNKFLVASSKGATQYIFNSSQVTIQSPSKIGQQFTTAVAYLDGLPLYCNSDGNIYYKQKTYKKDHGCVFCIRVIKDLIYLSGSQTKKLFILNKDFQTISQYILQQYARSIDVFQQSIILGLRNGLIVEITGQQITQIMNCHFNGQVWGLCYNKQNNSFITSGDDDKIIHFDIGSKKVTNVYNVSNKNQQNTLYYKNQLCCFPSSKQSRAIVINDNKMVYSTNFGQLIMILLDSNKKFSYQMNDRAECLQFSFDGQILAVGCYDDCILIFQVSQQTGFKLISTLSGHCSCVNDLSFDIEGNYLRSAGVQGQLRYWNLKTMKQVIINSKNCTRQELKIIKNAAWVGLCRFGWQTDSIWKQKYDHEFFNKISLSQSQYYLALGQDDNCIRIYNVPTDKVFRKYRGHSSHVINVCWSEDDQYLASVGGPDRTLMIWKVKQSQ